MSRVIPKVATRGASIGICNICGRNAQLTDDHIPPKGLLKPTQLEMLSLCESLDLEKFKKSKRFSQNGLKFKTLCTDCNNNLLGSQSDPSLISFANQAKNLLSSSIHLPENISVDTMPNRLCRSVVGHLLAARVNGHRIGTTTNSLTDYFLDTKANLPSDIEIYYWLYPYSDQVIVQGAGWMRDLGSSFAVISLLKFFPLAFLIISDKPSSWHFKFPSLRPHLSTNLDDTRPIPIDLINIPHQRWPEMPSSADVLLHSDSAIRAKLQAKSILLT